MTHFTNHYACPDCDIEWQDDWHAMSNDRCPTCRNEIEPHESDDHLPSMVQEFLTEDRALRLKAFRSAPDRLVNLLITWLVTNGWDRESLSLRRGDLRAELATQFGAVDA